MRGDELWLLITGSRWWTDRTMIRWALEREAVSFDGQPSQILVIHGKNGTYKDGKLVRGADMMADEEAKELGMRTRGIPADWSGPCDGTCYHGPRKLRRDGSTYCQQAGNRRNQLLVECEPNRGLAFPHPTRISSGTKDCMLKCKGAGVAVYNIPSLYKQLVSR